MRKRIASKSTHKPFPASVDLFCVRELFQSRLLSYLDNDLRRVVRTRPLMSVAVSDDRYSVGYSVAQVVLADRECPLQTASDPAIGYAEGTLAVASSSRSQVAVRTASAVPTS
jgi:hypothetical protein